MVSYGSLLTAASKSGSEYQKGLRTHSLVPVLVHMVKRIFLVFNWNFLHHMLKFPLLLLPHITKNILASATLLPITHHVFICPHNFNYYYQQHKLEGKKIPSIHLPLTAPFISSTSYSTILFSKLTVDLKQTRDLSGLEVNNNSSFAFGCFLSIFLISENHHRFPQLAQLQVCCQAILTNILAFTPKKTSRKEKKAVNCVSGSS